MQKHPLETETADGAVKIALAVFIVASDTVATRLHGDANLMRAPRIQPRFQQRRLDETLLDAKQRARLLPRCRADHHALAAAQLPLLHTQPHLAHLVVPDAVHQAEIALFHAACLHQRLKT